MCWTMNTFLDYLIIYFFIILEKNKMKRKAERNSGMKNKINKI